MEGLPIANDGSFSVTDERCHHIPVALKLHVLLLQL